MLANRVRMSKRSNKEYLYDRGTEYVPLILETTFWNSVLEKRSDHIYIRSPRRSGSNSDQYISSEEMIDFSNYAGIGIEISGTMDISPTNYDSAARFGHSYNPIGVNLSNTYTITQDDLIAGKVEHRFSSNDMKYLKFFSRTFNADVETELRIYSIYLITK